MLQASCSYHYFELNMGLLVVRRRNTSQPAKQAASTLTSRAVPQTKLADCGSSRTARAAGARAIAARRTKSYIR